MRFPFLLVAAAQLATVCSLEATKLDQKRQPHSSEGFLFKRGIEYSPFNKFFVERVHGNKFSGGSPSEIPPEIPDSGLGKGSGVPVNSSISQVPVQLGLPISSVSSTTNPTLTGAPSIQSDVKPIPSEVSVGKGKSGETRIQANLSLFLNSTIYVKQMGKGLGTDKVNTPNQGLIYGNGNPAQLEASPEIARENPASVVYFGNAGIAIPESTSTITTTLTSYVHGLQGTRTELRKVTTTVCDENVPCANTEAMVDPLIPQNGGKISGGEIPGGEPLMGSEIHTAIAELLPSPTSDLTTTLTSTLTIKKLRTYDSTIMSTTCSTKKEKDETKTIWNAGVTKTTGNATFPRPASIYEGRARVLALDIVLASMCGVIFFFY